MQDLKDFECPICLQYCIDAVESQCCGHAFCETCAKDVSGTKKECPFCRSNDFQASPSKILRRMISSIKVQCPNQKCQKKIQNSDLDKHLEECEFKEFKCKYCEYIGFPDKIYEHLIEQHKEESKSLLLKDLEDANPTVQSRKSKILTISKIKSEKEQKKSFIEGFDPLSLPQNIYGKKAGIGESGKFYCGGKLEPPKCMCCDGTCGPTNGQNCAGCMELDLALHGLMGKGYLVNSQGQICKVVNKKPYCGRIVSRGFSSHQCSQDRQCDPCKRMTLPRYQHLLD